MFKDFTKLLVWLIPIVLLAIIILPQMIRILREYERGVIFRLGKLLGTKGPGLIFLIPIVDRMVRMDLRLGTSDVARQEVMTRDNVPMTVDAVVYFRVVDPAAAVARVENYLKVTAVEVRDVILPDSMKRAMAGQAESERERRAKIINAEGEYQAAEKLVQAAAMISAQPIALQLRFLQTMKEISSEHSTTTILPVPINLVRPFIKSYESRTPKEP